MSKKTATIILTVIFMVIFIFVGIGSCGGVKYLINNRSERSLSNTTVYADEIGGGAINSTTEYLSVSLSKYYFYVDGYRGLGFPEGGASDYLPLGDFRFVAVYNNDSLVSFNVYTLQLTGYYSGGFYHTEGLDYVNTDLTTMNLIPIAFMNIYGYYLQPGCLEFSGPLVDLLTCGRFLAVNVDMIAGDFHTAGFNLSLVFENVVYNYVVSPYRWPEYGIYEINYRLDNLSYNETFAIGNVNSFVNADSYYQKGYDEAYKEYYQSRFDQGYSQGEQRGIEVGYAQGISEANDYTFLSLISSAIDVPVKAFIGLTDFNFLGFNMSTFYKAIFGFAIIVIILRVILP